MKILDCTLRDGGYYTNWDFDKQLIETYLISMNNLPVEYLEVGYRSPELSGYYGEYFYCPDFVLKKIFHLSNKKLVIILNEKDIEIDNVENLLQPCIGIITMVRIAIDPNNLLGAIALAKKVKEMNFEVGFNVMYMSKWKELPDFLSNLKHVDGVADYFYMVDSYGGVYPEDVKEIYNLVRSQMKTKIGFHGHNNLELALINSLTAIECGADIIDATITGMGRGAGNLKTELLLTALNQKNDLEVDFNALSQVTDSFTTLQNEHNWGTNLPYMVSGANSLPQKDVMEWVSKRYFSINSIVRALHQQKNQDTFQFPYFSLNKKIKQGVIIGGGSSAIEKSEAILEFVKRFGNDIAIIHASSKNSLAFINTKGDHYYCLAGNEGNRLATVFQNIHEFIGICVLPPSPRKMGTYVPDQLTKDVCELNEVNFTNLLNDSHTAIALQIALNLNIENCYVIGYDGYANEKVGTKEQELFIENELLFENAIEKGIKLIALTPTRYKSLKSDSIYSKI